MTRAELRKRIDAVEESYEFFLGYAAQGLSGKEESSASGQVRDFLRRIDDALTGLAEGFAALVESEGRSPVQPYHAMTMILRRDAADAQAAIRLVLAQPSVSSQLVDNLNASIHVRATLTDLFLLDEILKD